MTNSRITDEQLAEALKQYAKPDEEIPSTLAQHALEEWQKMKEILEVKK